MINIMIKLISISLISTKSITNSNNMPVVTRSAYNVRRDAITHMRIIEENCRLEQICAICHDEIRGSNVFHLPCGHTFHKACLINQLRHGRQWATKCAVCRTEHREALLENSETRQYVQSLDSSIEGVFTMMVPISGNNGDGGEQPPFWGILVSNEGDDYQNGVNHTLIVNMMNNYIETQDEGGIEPDASEASMEEDEENPQEGQESDMTAPDYEYNMNDEYEDDDLDSEYYHYGPQTWTGTFYSMDYPANYVVSDATSQESDSTQDQSGSRTASV